MPKFFYGWWIVLACCLNGFYVAGVVFYGFTDFFEPIASQFGWSHTEISFAASLRGLEMGLFAPFAGLIADRMGSRKLIFWGTFTVGFGLILLSFTQSLVMFYGAFLLLGLGAGGCTAVATMSAVANWFHKKIGIALGLMASGIGASGLMVPIIVYLIEKTDWRTTLIILGLGMWFLGIPISLIIRNRPEQYGYHPDGIPPDESAHRVNHKKLEKEIGLREALKNNNFLILNLAEALRMLIVASVVVHVMPYLTGLGMSRATAGIAAAAIPLMSIIGRFGFGWLGDLYAKKFVMAWAFFVMSLGMLAFQYAGVGWVLFLFLILFPPGYGGGMVLRGASLREYFGRKSFGKIIGITMGSSSIGGILGPTLAGFVFDFWGTYHFLWLFLSGAGILGMYLLLRIR